MAEEYIENALARIDNIESGVQVFSGIGRSPYATRLAQGLSRPIANACNGLTKALWRGRPIMRLGIGTRPLGDGFYELRADNAARVIVRQVAPRVFDIVGKFQGHVRGDAANSQIIQRLIQDYVQRIPQGR